MTKKKENRFDKKEVESILKTMPKNEIIEYALAYREGYFEMVKKYEKLQRKNDKAKVG